MKKILKKEVLVAFIIGLLIASSITIYAYSYVASDIKYKKSGEDTEISVEDALNELYAKKLDSSTLHMVNLGNFASTSAASVDIKSQVSNYADLTKDNFWLRNVRTSYTSATWSDYNLGGPAETISYNPSTGVVTVQASYGSWSSQKHAIYHSYTLYCIY